MIDRRLALCTVAGLFCIHGEDRDPALEPPRIILSPGPEYADANRKFQGIPGIERARNLSEAMMRNIKQNLFFAFIYNILGVPVAAGVLYPFFGLLLSPMIASAAMTLSSVTVIGNALRLRRTRL